MTDPASERRAASILAVVTLMFSVARVIAAFVVDLGTVGLQSKASLTQTH
jgi:hypothetical protein